MHISLMINKGQDQGMIAVLIKSKMMVWELQCNF